jgi:hypothetical protein
MLCIFSDLKKSHSKKIRLTDSRVNTYGRTDRRDEANRRGLRLCIRGRILFDIRMSINNINERLYLHTQGFFSLTQ